MKLSTEERKKQIIEASLELIKSGGIQNLTMKTISQKIGISEQAIYRHFDNKMDILLSILEHFNDSFKSMADHMKLPDDAPGKIHILTNEHLTFFSKNPAFAAVIFSEEIFQNEPQLVHAVSQALNKKFEDMGKIIKEGQEKGEIVKDYEPEILSHMLLGSLRLMVTRWRLDNFTFNIVQKGDQIVDSIIRLIKTK